MPHRILDDAAADTNTVYPSPEDLCDVDQDEASDVDTDAIEITSFGDVEGDNEHTEGCATPSGIAMRGLPPLLLPMLFAGRPGEISQLCFRDVKVFKVRNPEGGPSELSVQLRLKGMTFIPPKAFQKHALDYLLQQRAFRDPDLVSATQPDDVDILTGQRVLDLPLQQALDDRYLFPQVNGMLARSQYYTTTAIRDAWKDGGPRREPQEIDRALWHFTSALTKGNV